MPFKEDHVSRIGWMLLIIIGLAVEAAPVSTGHAQTQPPAPYVAPPARTEALTLPLAVDIALRTHPQVRAMTYGRALADAQLSEAQASRLPLLQFSETFVRSNNPVFVFGSLLEQGRFGPQNFDIHSLNHPDSLYNFRTGMALRLPLFDQRQTGGRIAQARIGQEEADRQKERTEQQVRFEVIRAYYGVLVAQAKEKVAEEAVKMAEAEVQRLRDLFEIGSVVESDRLAAEVQLAEFRQQQVQSAGEVLTAYAALNTLLGWPVQEHPIIKDELVERAFEMAGPEELSRLALRYRPDYIRAGLAVHSAEQQSHSERGQFLPRLDLFATYGASTRGLSSGHADYTVGASLTFNILDWGRRARIRQARVAESLAEAEQEQIANQIRLEVVQTYQHYVSAREQLNVAARTIQQANEARRIVQDRYQAGLTTITEMLRVETTAVRVQMNLLTARYDCYIGYAQVLLASGRLTDVRPFVD